MHKYLRSIGFSTYKSRRELQSVVDWVLRNPDHVSMVSMDDDTNLAVAERETAGHAGVAVVGEIDESGKMVPEYYYPFLVSSQISSDARLSYEHERTKNGLIGMCEDHRLGMSLIFSVRNLAEVLNDEMNPTFAAEFTKVSLSALASDGKVLLPVLQAEKVLQNSQELHRQELQENADHGDLSALAELTGVEMERYQRLMEHLHESDIYTLVDSFFMPHGMESDQYYFMGTITACQLIRNELTEESFYRMMVVSNGIPLLVAINEKDLQGVPAEGLRFKGHAWVTGDLRR